MSEISDTELNEWQRLYDEANPPLDQSVMFPTKASELLRVVAPKALPRLIEAYREKVIECATLRRELGTFSERNVYALRQRVEEVQAWAKLWKESAKFNRGWYKLTYDQAQRWRRESCEQRDRAEKAEAELQIITNLIQKYQPAGSPPPGGREALVRWVLENLSKDEKGE